MSLTGISSAFNTTIAIWLPTVLIREHGMTASQAGYTIALVAVPAGLFGNFFWQWWGTRLQMRNAAKGHVHAFIIPTLMTGPCYIAGFLTSNVTLQLVGFAAGLFAGVAFNVLTQIAIQFYTPAQMRARMVSINYLAVSLLGYGLGPSAAVELGQHLTEGSSDLRYGLIGLTAIAWPLLILVTMTAVRNADGPAEA